MMSFGAIAIKACLFFSFCVFPLELSAQSESIHTLAGYVKKINQFNKLNPQEKVYLHFDNTGYFIGDTIWFKAYSVFAEHHHPTSLSKVLHVELLTPLGEIIDTRKLKIDNRGQCHGEFALKNEYHCGFYEVRAYTRSMLNFGNDCVFSRVFPIYNEPETAGDYADRKMDVFGSTQNKREMQKEGSKVNLSFYPEGGNAVLGLRSRVAFKARGENGEDLNITGTVYNSSDEPVAYLSTYHQGMGFIEFLPETTSYKVSIEHDGKKYDFPFPEILPAGYVMRVNDTDKDYYQVELQKSAGLPGDTVAVSISCRGTVHAVEAAKLGNAPYTFRVPKSRFPAGCLQFTLYDIHGNILAERLSFNTHPLKYASVSVETDKPAYRPLEKVDMLLSMKDPDGNPQEGGFSLAVRDAGTEAYTSYQDNILTDLLISSDIRGYVTHPMQYFEKDDRVTRIKLDLLMMVQGWRRYDWRLMAGLSPFKASHYAEEALPVSGKVMALLRDKIKKGSDVVFWMTKEGSVFHGRCKTDENGRFHFLLPDSAQIEGEWQLGLSVTEKKKQKHCRIVLDRLFSPTARSYEYEELLTKDTITVIEDGETDSLKNRRFVNDIQHLPQVVIKRRKLEKSALPSSVYNVEKDVNELMDLGKNYPGSLGEYMEDFIPGVRRDSSNAPYVYQNKDIAYLYYGKGSAARSPRKGLFAGDSADFTFELPIESIKKLEVFDATAYFWLIRNINNTNIEVEISAGNASTYMSNLLARPRLPLIILIHSYNDSMHGGYKKGVRYTYFYGYSPVREFYQADHSRSIPGDIDFRRTLYWNPNVKTDSQGRAKISFYNNSTCRKMTVSAEGITGQGMPIINH